MSPAMASVDAIAIRECLTPDVAVRMEHLDVFAEVGSTNSYLLQQEAPDPGWFRVAIADHQTGGRGRQGREWLSAPGSSLCLSLAYTFAGSPENLPGLTIALGVAALHTLRATGIDDVSLKWPNDLVAHNSKLGGILAETLSRGETNSTIIAGIGINFDLPAQLIRDNASDWAQRAIDISVLTRNPPTRETLSAELIGQIVDAFVLFEEQGLDAFVDFWRRNDWLRGRTVTVEESGGRVHGTACGIDDNGALLVREGSNITRVTSGSIVVECVTGSVA
jgi:BirA family biotin operon repressor/biotin-[acetyl-CoA-carboxylase] ligase